MIQVLKEMDPCYDYDEYAYACCDCKSGDNDSKGFGD